MMRLLGQLSRTALIAVSVSLCFQIGCGGTAAGSDDAGQTTPDAGQVADAGQHPDAGDAGQPADAGDAGPVADAGEPDAGDAGQAADAGDAGSTPIPTDGTGVVTPASGGTISLDGGATLEVPPGAVSADTTITIARSSETPPDGALSPIFVFGPEGATFAAPITVTIPASGTAGSIYWTTAGSSTQYETVTTTFAGGAARGQISHFSRGFAGAACTESAACGAPAVCHAGALTCQSGAPVCVDSVAPDGAVCGPDLVCSAGQCLSATRTVSGTFKTFYERDDGTVEEAAGSPFQLPNFIVYPDGAGGAVHQALVTDTDGNYSVPGVPRGTYYLDDSFETGCTDAQDNFVPCMFHQMFPLTADTPDLSNFIHGRSTATFATNSTPVTLDVTGLDPWSSTDSLFVTPTQVFTTQEATHAQKPASGVTRATVTFDWSTGQFGEGVLPDAAQGDITYFYQLHAKPLAEGVDVLLADRVAVSSSFSLANGLEGGATVALQAAPLSSSVPTAVAFSQFAATLPEMNPAASLTADPSSFQPFASVEISSRPGPLAFPKGDPFAPEGWIIQARYRYPKLDTDTDFGPLSYGGFTDSTFHDVWRFIYDATFTLDVDGSKVDALVGYLVEIPVGELPDVVVPTMTPARKPLINGKDAFQPQTGVGLTPTITWTPPATGKASVYVVQINLLSAPDDATTVGFVQSRVYGTSFTVPAGFLQAGKTYNADIVALQGENDQDQPFRVGTASVQVDTMTNTFKP
ncbi:MAG TPA: hypothetical protein VH083_02530 [Myxococcales bacterium]|nr:hypothetical protein [Myxococcales bacterium]